MKYKYLMYTQKKDNMMCKGGSVIQALKKLNNVHNLSDIIVSECEAYKKADRPPKCFIHLNLPFIQKLIKQVY